MVSQRDERLLHVQIEDSESTGRLERLPQRVQVGHRCVLSSVLEAKRSCFLLTHDEEEAGKLVAAVFFLSTVSSSAIFFFNRMPDLKKK